MYHLELRTDKDMGSKEFVTRFLHDWYHHDNELMRPELYDMGEPIRKKIRERGIDAAANEWLMNKMPVLLKRKTSPKFDVDMSWREDKGLDPRLFPWECRVWLDAKAGDELVISFLRFLICYLTPAFCSATTQVDYEKKHYIEYESRFGTNQMYIGRDVGGKSIRGDVCATLPGLYWVTYFSKWAIGKIGRQRFENLDVHSIEEYQDGYLVTVHKDSSSIGTPEAKVSESEIINRLGKNLFFDKSQVNLSDLLGE